MEQKRIMHCSASNSTNNAESSIHRFNIFVGHLRNLDGIFIVSVLSTCPDDIHTKYELVAMETVQISRKLGTPFVTKINCNARACTGISKIARLRSIPSRMLYELFVQLYRNR